MASSSPHARPHTRSLAALDAANFFLADVRDGLGPYLAIYLLSTLHWDAQHIGIAMSVMGMATVFAQTPAGILVDRTRRKRLFSVIASLLIAVASIAMILLPYSGVVFGSQVVMGIAAAWFVPAIAAITLGLVGARSLDRRIGRNEMFNHAGNVCAAMLAGLIGYFFRIEGIFLLLAFMALLSSIAIWRICENDIDHDEARGMIRESDDSHSNSPSPFMAMMENRPLLFFALACVLFHFANAAMLPLLGQRLAQGISSGASSAYMSACIIVAQLVMIQNFQIDLELFV